MADWNALMGAPNAGAAFLDAFQRGREQRRQDAMQKQQMDEHQQDRALRQKQIEAQIAQSGVEQHREAIKTGAAIIRQVKPQDQAGWDRALSALQQYGINPDQVGVPRQFSPDYANQIVSLADALDPQKADRPQLVPFTQGGGVAAYDPNTQQMRVLVQPNEGGHQAGAPVNAPQVLTDEEMRAMEGGQTGSGSSGGFRQPF